MTINEMHIAVNLGVQKIASFQVDNFLSEEVDHELNIAMDRFIKQRYNPLSNRFRKGFEQSQKRIDDLRNLVVVARIDSFQGDSFAYGDSDGEFFGTDKVALPNDYMFLVNLRAIVNDACQIAAINVEENSFSFQRISLTPPVTGYILTQIRTVLYDGGDLTEIAYNTAGLTKDQLLNNATYANAVTLVPSLSLEQLNTDIIEQSPTADGNELFLKFSQELYNGSFATELTWEHPTNSVTTGGTIPITFVPMESAETVLIKKRFIVGKNVDRKVSCNFAQLDDIYTLLDDPFNTTKSTSPLYTIEENFITFHTNQEFVVEKADVQYIRSPQRMTKTLGVGCELSEHTHQEIVEMAVKSILESVQDARYQSQSVEVTESE